MTNTVEKVRLEMGVTRPKMLELLGAAPGSLNIFTLPDDSLKLGYLKRSASLQKQYAVWKAYILDRLQTHEERGLPTLTALEVQDLFSLREMHVHQLRHRGVLEAVRDGFEYRYPIDALRRLLDLNSLAITQEKRLRGPLTYGFLRWLGGLGSGGFDIAALGRSTPNIDTTHNEVEEKVLAGRA